MSAPRSSRRPCRLDRRGDIRLQNDADRACDVAGRGGADTPAWLWDISRIGIGLVLEGDDRRTPGDIVSIRLESPHGGCSRLRARVVHSDICLPNDAVLHGCALLEPIPAREVS